MHVWLLGFLSIIQSVFLEARLQPSDFNVAALDSLVLSRQLSVHRTCIGIRVACCPRNLLDELVVEK